MKEWLKEFISSYEQWVHDTTPSRALTQPFVNTTVYYEQFLENYLSDHPLPLPTNESVYRFLKKQNYQKEEGEQEYYMYYDVDMPKIIRDWIKLKMK